MFTDVENTDLGDGSKKAKKIDDLSKIHSLFWNSISPIALLLNPKIGDYKKLLTTKQINDAKSSILKRMRKYPMKTHEKEQPQEPSRYDEFNIIPNEQTEEELLSPLEKLLARKQGPVGDLKSFWMSKIDTEEQQLGYVALEILGLLITSVLTERSFSKSRYVINNLRTNISPEHARAQMMIKCNRKIAMEIFERIDIFQTDFDE